MFYFAHFGYDRKSRAIRFSKLKLIKPYFRPPIAQDRLDTLALFSIEKKTAKNLDLDKPVDRFVYAKTRKK